MTPGLPHTDWLVHPFLQGSPEAVLEVGPALLEAAAAQPRPALRWYRADATAIVLGQGQADQLVAGDLPVLRRRSGGGAVLLGPALLCLDLVVPAGHAWLAGDLGAVFLRVGQAWRAALHDLGVPGLVVHQGPSQARRRGTEHERLLAAICYATRGRGEVLAGGRKLVGLAQRRRRHAALVQCGLLRRWEPSALLAALGADAEDPVVARAAVGLEELVPDPPGDAVIMRAVQKQLMGEGHLPAPTGGQAPEAAAGRIDGG